MAALMQGRPRGTRPASVPVPGSARPGSRRLGPPAGGRGRRQAKGRPVLALVALVALVATGGALVDAVAPVAGGQDRRAALGVPAEPTEVRVHVVRAGETYWSIAEARGGSGDIRARIDALQMANGERLLRAGDRLVLPE